MGQKIVAKAAKGAKPKAKKPKAGLTFQQRVFVAEYLKDGNGTQAAIRAGYSEKTAGSQAFDLLKKPEIKAQVEGFVAKAEEKAVLSVERTLREVARLSYFDARKLLNADGSPKAVQDLDDDTAACIAGLEVLEQFEGSGDDRTFVGYLKKYKIADKNAALEKAMKHLGLYEKDNEQKPAAEVVAKIVIVPPKQAAETSVSKIKRGD